MNDGCWQEWEEKWKRVAGGGFDMLYEHPTQLGWQHKCYFDDIWERMDYDTSAAYLELGCGRGTITQYLVNLGCGDVTIVDRSPTAIVIAKRNFRVMDMNPPDCLEADAANTGMPKNTFNCRVNFGPQGNPSNVCDDEHAAIVKFQDSDVATRGGSRRT